MLGQPNYEYIMLYSCVQILEYTSLDHSDRADLEDCLSKAQEICNQVNEGVRETENSDKLEWIQKHVHCDGLSEVIKVQ